MSKVTLALTAVVALLLGGTLGVLNAKRGGHDTVSLLAVAVCGQYLGSIEVDRSGAQRSYDASALPAEKLAELAKSLKLPNQNMGGLDIPCPAPNSQEGT